MLSILRTTLVAAALGVGLAADAAAQGSSPGPTVAPKLAYINSQRILEQAPGRAEAEAQFQREMTGYQEQIKRMGDSLKTLVDAYNKQELILSPAAKETKQKEIRTREEQYQERIQRLQQQAQQREQDLVRPIMQQINQVINTIRAEEGYAMIFDVAAQGGSVVAADTTLDITGRVIARLRTTAAATKPAARPAGATSPPQPAGVSRPKNPPRDR
jgi:outer membrane protein